MVADEGAKRLNLQTTVTKRALASEVNLTQMSDLIISFDICQANVGEISPKRYKRLGKGDI